MHRHMGFSWKGVVDLVSDDESSKREAEIRSKRKTEIVIIDSDDERGILPKFKFKDSSGGKTSSIHTVISRNTHARTPSRSSGQRAKKQKINASQGVFKTKQHVREGNKSRGQEFDSEFNVDPPEQASDSPLASRTNILQPNQKRIPRVVLTQEQKISSDRLSVGDDSLHEEIKAKLQDVDEIMAEQHAVLVRDQLHEAKNGRDTLLQTLPDFRLDTSPFAHMVALPKDASGRDSLRITHMFYKKDGKREKRILQVPVKTIRSGVERAPKFKHYVEIDRSFLVNDTNQLEYMPYFGDGDVETENREAVKNDLIHVFGNAKELLISRRAEFASEIKPHIPRLLGSVGMALQDVVQALPIAYGNEGEDLSSASSDDEIDPGTNSSGLQEIASSQVALNLSEDKSRRIKAFLDEFACHFGSPFSEIIQKIFKPSLPVIASYKPPLEKLLDSYDNMVCALCGIHDCKYHSKKYWLSNSQIEMRKAGQRPTKCTEELSNSSIPKINIDFCSKECYMRESTRENSLEDSWKTEETSLLQGLISDIEHEVQVSCSIWPVLGKTCKEVHNKILVTLSGVQSAKQTAARETKRLYWYNNQTKKINVEDFGQYTKTHSHHNRAMPKPCFHPGRSCHEAGDKCSCMAHDVLCERHCACSADCFLRFTGCECVHPCRNNSREDSKCICAQLNRECDPDLCHNCSSGKAADPANLHEPYPPGCCQNVAIQRAVPKRMMVGECTTRNIGYGVFMAEPASKGEYIGEYVGEIITHAEAENRGIVYDQNRTSYLFDLNKSHTIDAARYGNITRFINHSADANVIPMVLLVSGEHRIGFFAGKNIKIGEELWFHYGDEFEKKHGLFEREGAKTMGSTAIGGAKGRGRGGRDVAKEYQDRGRDEAKGAAKKSLTVCTGTGPKNPFTGISQQLRRKKGSNSNSTAGRPTSITRRSSAGDFEESQVHNSITFQGRPKRLSARPKKYTR